MFKRYKILILDVDGTLVDSDRHALPSARIVEAVQAARDKVIVTLATGRPIELAEPVITKLDIGGIGVFNGGAEIIDIDSGKLLHQQKISAEKMRELLVLAKPFGYKMYTAEDQYQTPTTDPDTIKTDAAKFFIEAVRTDDALPIIEQLSAVEGVVAHPTTSWASKDVVDIHVNHEHASKRYGVEKMLALLGIPAEQAIAIGDGHNDVPMMEAAGFKVAMGNAPDEVKAVADFVAPSLDDDGVAAVIERFILAEG